MWWNTKTRWRSQMNTKTTMAALYETQRQQWRPLMKHRDKMAALKETQRQDAQYGQAYKAQLLGKDNGEKEN